MLKREMTLSEGIRGQESTSPAISGGKRYVLNQLEWHVIPTLIILVGVGWFFLNVAETQQAQKYATTTQTLIAHAEADMGEK